MTNPFVYLFIEPV